VRAERFITNMVMAEVRPLATYMVAASIGKGKHLIEG